MKLLNNVIFAVLIIFILSLGIITIAAIPMSYRPSRFKYRTASGVIGESNSCVMTYRYTVPTCTLNGNRGIVVVESFWRIEND